MLNASFELQLSEALRHVEEALHDLPMQVGGIIAQEIHRNTEDLSRSPDGTAFTPYSPKYIPKRQRYGLRTDRVDLHFTGRYIHSIQPRREGSDVYVSPGEEFEKQALGLNRLRPHIGISPEVPQLVEAMLEKVIGGLL